MNPVLATLLLLDLALIGALPRVFFRRGRLNAAWWLTAMPFLAGASLVLAAATGRVAPRLPANALLGTSLEVIATLLCAASIALIALTCGTHRRAISLWHQEDDRPQGLVTAGPYARVRHPFYTAFLLALSAVAVGVPHVATAVVLAFGFVVLDRTAAREERRLSASVFGAEYRAYKARTGRFRPRLRRLAR